MEDSFIWITAEHVETVRLTKQCQVDDIVVSGLQVGQTIRVVCVCFSTPVDTKAKIRQIIPTLGTDRGSVVLGS